MQQCSLEDIRIIALAVNKLQKAERGWECDRGLEVSASVKKGEAEKSEEVTGWAARGMG